MNIRQIASACVLVLAGGIAPANAELVATPLAGDTRLVQFTFDEDNTFLLLAKPKAVTHVQFAADETIQSIAAGDTAQWELTPTKNRKNLFIKPKYEGLETSMTVITDRRIYQFVLRSTGDGKKWYQRVSWLYNQNLVLEQVGEMRPEAGFVLPDPAMSAPGVRPTQPAFNMQGGAFGAGLGAEGLNPESLRFDYKIEGSAPFRPTQVFDNGKFTYLRLPNDLQDLPVIFEVNAEGDYALVHYVIKGDYLVVQRLLDQGVLKLGKAEVRIHRVKPSKGFFGLFQGEGGQ